MTQVKLFLAGLEIRVVLPKRKKKKKTAEAKNKPRKFGKSLSSFKKYLRGSSYIPRLELI